MKQILSILLLTWGTAIFAQGVECGSDHAEREVLKHPELREQYLKGRELQHELASKPSTKRSDEVYIIPVVYHVLYWDSIDNISEAQLRDGLAVLNEDFRRMNADTANTRSIFKHLGADVQVEFRLATRDPQGNPTNGIQRIKEYMTVWAPPSVRLIDQWPNERYFNIWVVRKIQEGSGGTPGTTTLGYAFKPFPGQTGDYDGMVIRNDQVGRIGTALNSPFANSSNQKGRTMTHESGHYLGLDHTFEGSCDSLRNVGDRIDDTPPVAAPNFQCDFSANSCHNDSVDLPDMIENYMDYAPGRCMNIFTHDQRELMRACFANASLRGMLIRQSNLERTGVLHTAERSVEEFGIYPNPNNGQFTLKSSRSLRAYDLEILDISGRRVYGFTIQADQSEVEVQMPMALQSGVYLLKLSNGKVDILTRRLIIE